MRERFPNVEITELFAACMLNPVCGCFRSAGTRLTSAPVSMRRERPDIWSLT